MEMLAQIHHGDAVETLAQMSWRCHGDAVETPAELPQEVQTSAGLLPHLAVRRVKEPFKKQ